MLTQLPDGWVTRKLGEVVELSQGLAINVKTKHLLVKAGIPLLRITDLINNMQIQFIDANNAPTKCIANIGDVIYTRTGQVGLVFNNRYGVLHNNCFKVTPSIDNLDRNYLYWFLSQTSVYELANSMASGSVQKDLPHSAFKTIYINLPPLTIQQKIASILSTINEQIDINNQINKKLEEIAQVLFKQWFIDFNFPDENGKPYKDSGGALIDSELGKIPKGWSVSTIGQYVKVKSGFAFKSSWWTTNGAKVIKIKDILNNTISFSELSHVPIDKTIKANEFIVKTGDLLIAMTGATVGKIGLVPETDFKLLVNQRVGKFFLGNNPINKVGFLYMNILQDSVKYQIYSRANGSAQANISPSDIESIKIIMPQQVIIDLLNYIVAPIFENMCKNISQNNKLQQIRDSLLPKLMSGEIGISNEK